MFDGIGSLPMPIYEYQCESCGKIFEMMQKFSDPPASVCTECGKGPVQKLISRTSFQLKGGGWYASDYKKPSSPAEPAAAKPAPSTDTKPKPDGGNSTPSS